jgi:hypothetical protein
MFLLRLIWTTARGRFAKKADLSVPAPHRAEGRLAAGTEWLSCPGENVWTVCSPQLFALTAPG